MTLLPHVNWDVHGAPGTPYKVGPKCAVSTCNKWADHAHHIWRRSFLAGDYRYVRLWDGTIVRNLCGLCWQHHNEITENRSAISYDDRDGTFWYDGIPLDALPADAAPPQGSGQSVEEDCPTCGRRKKKKDDFEPGEKRNRSSWNVSVPKDEREDGADVLDTLELACAEKLGRADHASHKYFTIAEVLAYFLQNYGLDEQDDR